jgi:hypothetical protein
MEKEASRTENIFRYVSSNCRQMSSGVEAEFEPTTIYSNYKEKILRSFEAAKGTTNFCHLMHRHLKGKGCRDGLDQIDSG